ncbi:hypothetical protein [Variovorax sp. LT1R16]|uniref:hypothetical protein n=1 Tax=Variovorax sp. LT1R16 TaxID=3443728 RepID=UPI003F47F00F
MNVVIGEELKVEIERAAQLAGLSAQNYVLSAILAQLAHDAANATEDEMNNAVRSAVQLVEALTPGEQFTLEQLAQNVVWWDEMRADSHNAVGTEFKKAIIAVGTAEFLGTNTANAAVYRRIENDGRPRYNQPRRNLGPRN